MFQKERAGWMSRPRYSPDQAARNFVEVARRVEPIEKRLTRPMKTGLPW
jgi:hypothetical protein